MKPGDLVKIKLSGRDFIGIITKVEGPYKNKTWFIISGGRTHWTHKNNLEVVSEAG